MALDIYKILNVGERATAEEVRAAYLRLASEIHPDLNSQDAAAELRFKEIQKAYEILGNPRSRAEYDRNAQRRQARTTAATSSSQTSHVTTPAPARTVNPWQQHGGATVGFDFFDRATAMRSKHRRFLLAASVWMFVVVVAIIGLERWSAHHNVPLLVNSSMTFDRGDDNATSDLSRDGDGAFNSRSGQPHEVGKLAVSGGVSTALPDPDDDQTLAAPGVDNLVFDSDHATDVSEQRAFKNLPITPKKPSLNALTSSDLNFVDAEFGARWDLPVPSLLDSLTPITDDVNWPMTSHPEKSVEFGAPALPQWRPAGTANNILAHADDYAAISRHFGAARQLQWVKIGTDSHDGITAEASVSRADPTHSQEQPYGGYVTGMSVQRFESHVSQQSVDAAYGNPWDQTRPITKPIGTSEPHQLSRLFDPFNEASSLAKTNMHSLHSSSEQKNSLPYRYGNVGNPSLDGRHHEGFGARLPGSYNWMRENSVGNSVGFSPTYGVPTLQSVLPTHGNSFTSPGTMAAGATSGSSFNW